jgi:hypothetical protein
VDPLVVQSPEIAHPTRINRVVLTRFIPVNPALARADDDVAASPAARAEALGFLEEPDPHLEPEILRGQRADRAKVDRVQGVIVVERPARIIRQRAVTAPLAMPSASSPTISRVNRMQREQRMHRSSSSMMRGPDRPASACAPWFRQTGSPTAHAQANTPAACTRPPGRRSGNPADD